MEQLPDDVLGLILAENEHAALCCRRYHTIVTDNLKLLHWIRQLLYGDFEDIRKLSFERLYHYVYTQCITKRRSLVNMSFNIGLREFLQKKRRAEPQRRLKMVSDVLMYWNNTRTRGNACLHRVIRKRTGVHTECRCKSG